MKMASPMASPSGRTPEQAPDGICFGTEACGGDISLLEERRMVSVFIGIYGGGIRSRRGQGPHKPGGTATPLVAWATWPLWEPRGSSRLLPKLLGSSLVPKKSCQKLASCLDLLDIDFLRNQKQAENRNWHWALN